MDKISIIVPCYNEESALPFFYAETAKELRKIKQTDYEFIFIDDGSRDHTLEVLRLMAYKDSRCKYFSFSRNFGKEAAMFAGLNEASGDYCVIMDADLQHPPTLLAPMYDAVKNEGYDCCAGKRIDRTGEGTIRNFCSRSFYKVIKSMTKMEMSDGDGDFRMMNRTMVNAILEMKEYNRYMKGVFSFVGFKTKWVEFHNVERVCGTTKWNFKSLLNYAFEGLLSFSTTPLKFAGVAGGILMALSMGLGIYVIADALFLSHIWHRTLLIIDLILFMSSLQMMFIFILGQYLAKDYLENKGRPIYILRETSRKLKKRSNNVG